MKKILFTHATTQNFQFVINLLKNLETYGHEFKFIKLTKEVQFTNNSKVPKKYIHIIKKFENYCNKLSIDISNIGKLINRLDKIFSEFNPDIVIIFGNKIDQTCGVLYEFSKLKKTKIFFSENTPIPGTFYIEKKPRFEFTRDFSNLNNITDNENYLKLINRGKKILNLIKRELPTRHNFSNKFSKNINFESKNKKILILGSSLVDHAILPKNHKYKKFTFPIFNHYSEMIDFLSQYKNIDIWFKPHPAKGFEKYYEEIKKRDNFHLFSYLDDINILMKKSDIVISTLSKLEINAIALDKKLILAGAGWFWSQNYCMTKKDLHDSISRAINKDFNFDKRYKNQLYACIAWYEEKYVNFYDYLTKKDLTSNKKQIEKFYKLIDINVDLKNKSKFNLKNINERQQYFKKIGWQPQHKFIILIKFILKKIYLLNLIKKIIRK